MPGRIFEFVQLDVFTQTPLAGNPLAVFTDGRGLDDSEMQAIAREMNLSETTFILPRDPAIEAREGKKVRIGAAFLLSVILSGILQVAV